MKNFNITWNMVQYSVPTIRSIWINGDEIISDPDKSFYIITPNKTDVIIFKNGGFYDLNWEKYGDDKVELLFQPFKV